MAQSLLFTMMRRASKLVTPSNIQHLHFQYLQTPHHQKPLSCMAQSLLFTVKRSAPELITPSKPTPHETKLLSDLDDTDMLRYHVPLIQFYNYKSIRKGKDPVEVIRKALAKTLVFYYPFAGRLREGPGRKLMVDCNEKGVLFIEADADVSLKDFGDALIPPFSFFDKLLYDVPGSSNMLNAPLMLIQVTRLRCGGFSFANRVNHTMSDGSGVAQFMNALAEISRGMNEPSISPVWCRDLLSARNPPRVTCCHSGLEKAPDNIETVVSFDNIVGRTFFFGPNEVAAIRALLPPNQQEQYSRFEILTGFLWRCRTKALQLDSNEEIGLMFVVNLRSKFVNLLFPNGYYGNAVANPVAFTTAGKVVENTLEYALNLIKTAKAKVSKEFVHSLVDLIVIEGRSVFPTTGIFLVSDVTRIRYRDIDFGWGKAIYGGPSSETRFPSMASFCIPFTNSKGDEGTVIPLSLPAQAMERFVKDIDSVLKANSSNQPTKDSPN